MKDQYFGDINDYRKYGLLRTVHAAGWRLLVAWMHTPDDGGRDGRFRSYLGAPRRWRASDPDLFDRISALLRSRSTPGVHLMGPSGLLRDTAYYSAVVPDELRARLDWQSGLFEAARGVDVVFLDPDNAIEVPSLPMGRKGSSKYVAWRDLQGLWNMGCSLLIYQHYGRQQRDRFAKRLAAQLREQIGIGFVEGFRTSHVLFLLAAQDRHVPTFVSAISSMTQTWAGQIKPIGLAYKPL